jgi:hypothetical protein
MYSLNCPLCFQRFSSQQQSRTPKEHCKFLRRSLVKHSQRLIHDKIIKESFSCMIDDCSRIFTQEAEGSNFVKSILLHAFEV